MIKVKPLYEKIYESELYMEIIRFVHYRGVVYRDLADKIEEWKRQFPRKDVCQAVYHMVTYEGENRTNVKPLEQVNLRPEVRKLAFQLLGPTPETWDKFYRNADGSPGPHHAEKMAELAKLNGTTEVKPKRVKKKK